MITISSYDKLGEITAALDEAALSGTLDTTLLSEAVETEDRAGYETIPSSIGIDWMWRNATVFGELIDDALAFYRNHIDNHYITAVLKNRDLFDLIPETEQTAFVRDVAMSCTISSYCVRTVIEAGVPRADLAEIVLDKLRATEVETPSNLVDFLSYEFLQYGAGSVSRSVFGNYGVSFRDEHTLWSVLSNEQLIEALYICIDKAPFLFFRGEDFNSRVSLTDKLDGRLCDRGLVDAILLDAATKLQSLASVVPSALDRLPFDVRLDLARKFGAQPALVVRLALDLGYENGGVALCEEFADSFSDVTDTSCQHLWSLQRSTEDTRMAQVIRDRLSAALARNGYVVGSVTTGSYFDRRSKQNLPQLEVRHGGTKYVQAQSQHRSFPKEGDVVIINTKYGRNLTPRVIAAPFAVL